MFPFFVFWLIGLLFVAFVEWLIYALIAISGHGCRSGGFELFATRSERRTPSTSQDHTRTVLKRALEHDNLLVASRLKSRLRENGKGGQRGSCDAADGGDVHEGDLRSGQREDVRTHGHAPRGGARWANPPQRGAGRPGLVRLRHLGVAGGVRALQ